MRIVALSSSPRKDGNSRLLGQAVLEGAAGQGHDTELVDLGDAVKAPLRDCRTCRQLDGACSIDDDYEQVIRSMVLPADAVVLATPLYWYGMSGQLKIFIDRLFCYISASAPDSDAVQAGLVGKRLLVAISSEESYPGAILGLTAQLQELARYLDWEFAGVVRGIGNSRGEIIRDPGQPLEQAREAGARLVRAARHRLPDRQPTSRPGLAGGGGSGCLKVIRAALFVDELRKWARLVR